MVNVKIEGTDQSHSDDARNGESLLDVLQRVEGLYVDAPCGGNGTCGKCVVEATGALSEPDEVERSIIPQEHLDQHVRLACRALVAGDCDVVVPSNDQGASILSNFEPLVATKDPLVMKESVELSPPSLEDQRPATRRLAEALGIGESEIPIGVRKSIAGSGGGQFNVLSAEGYVIDVDDGSRAHQLAAAVDIGTSTVVVYLVNLDTGLVVSSRSAMNPQKGFGADVISRIAYSSRGASEMNALQKKVVDKLQELVTTLAEEQGAGAEDIVAMTVVGNTTMLHLLAGVDPASIAKAPFAPGFTDAMRVEARELGFRLHPRALLWFLPGVASYVGADIVAGIVATDLDRAEKPVLLIDLGTNCEVVLGDRSGIVACATAAGPAFEGAEIDCGMAGVAGAVCRAWRDDTLHFETIASQPPRGICGSGIMDIMALLVETGLVESSGRLLSNEEALETGGISPEIASLIEEVEGSAENETGSRQLRLSKAAAGTHSGDVYFSQKDVRQVQLAKAAVAAGIEVLLSERGLEADDIDAIYLSGGFGNAMSPDSACWIGLFPKELRGRVRAVGNTAGRGAVLALRSRAELARFEEIRRNVRYVELSGHPLFMDPYVENMMFPEPDEIRALDPVTVNTAEKEEDSEARSARLFADRQTPLSPEEAVVEADRCLKCGGLYTAVPCVAACPTKIDIPGFIAAIGSGETAHAADIIFESNVLGASCARLCPAEQLCEGACVLLAEGKPAIEIARLQRFAAEPEVRRRSHFRTPGRSTGKVVSVIGAGPAGLSCAAELALRGYRVVVHEKNEEHGGLARYGAAPYRLLRDPLPYEANMIASLGVEFRLQSDVDSREKLEAIEAESDAVFLGTGLDGDVAVQYPGKELPGIWNALDFIRSIKTDRIPQIGERVGVIGGGNTAIDAAREAARLGAQSVTLYYRRTRAEMPAYPREVEEAIEDGVQFQFLTDLAAFHGEDRLEAIELKRMRLSEPDASGRPRAVSVPDSEFEVPVDTAILAIGQGRRKELFELIGGIDLENGLIKVDPTSLQTANPKYFAGGDSLNGGATVVEAVQHGKIAAGSIDRFLRSVE